MIDGPEALQGESSQVRAVGPEARIGLVPGIMENGLEVQGRDMEVPARVQSGEIETVAGPSGRQNPRRGVQLDITNTYDPIDYLLFNMISKFEGQRCSQSFRMALQR